ACTTALIGLPDYFLVTFVSTLVALIAAPATMIACLATGHRRLAAYVAVLGVVPAAIGSFPILYPFAVPITNVAVHGLLYALGLLFAVPYTFALLTQLRVGASI